MESMQWFPKELHTQDEMDRWTVGYLALPHFTLEFWVSQLLPIYCITMMIYLLYIDVIFSVSVELGGYFRRISHLAMYE